MSSADTLTARHHGQGDGPRYAPAALTGFATALAARLGLPEERAIVQAEILVEGDLMGHTTHGLHLLAGLLGEIEAGTMTGEGEPVVLADRPGLIHWDGRFLPGTWLVTRAIDAAAARLAETPVMAVLIRQCHHIAALGAYLRRVTERGHLLMILNSDPSSRTVAAHGGLDRQTTPNPIAFGYPTLGDPVLIDISASSTANGWVRRYMARGERLPGAWVIDHEGTATDDPAALFGSPPGALLPLGGLDLGHKGFALGLMVEALTSALTGYGRADGATGTGGPVTLLLIDPVAFGGLDAFRREASFLADSCRASRVRPGDPPVRLPGERALALRREQTERGVALVPSILKDLAPWAEKLGVPMPEPLAG